MKLVSPHVPFALASTPQPAKHSKLFLLEAGNFQKRGYGHVLSVQSLTEHSAKQGEQAEFRRRRGRVYLVNVSLRNELEHNVDRLPTNVQVRARESAEHVHDHVLHHLLERSPEGKKNSCHKSPPENSSASPCRHATHLAVVELQLIQAVEDDELHVVVALRSEQLRVAVGRCPDGRGGRGHGHEAAGAFVHYGGVVRVEQADDDFDVLALLRRCGAADLSTAIDFQSDQCDAASSTRRK